MTFSPQQPRRGRMAPDEADDAYERIIPFNRTRRRTAQAPSAADERERPNILVNTRLGAVETDERASAASPERRAVGTRRRRQRGSWLQRNALSLLGMVLLLAMLGVGFGLSQVLSRAASPASGAATNGPALSALPTTSAPGSNATSGTAPSASDATTPAQPAADVPSGPRTVQSSVKPLDATYTVQSGDTLGGIATRFHTTVQRIQALNNLSDPRLLHVGDKLVIPPAF